MSLRIAAALAFLVALPQVANAKAERTVGHAFEKVWPTAIRHLRVEEGHKIVDKDAEAGYVVFVVEDDGKKFKGSLELIKTKDSDDSDVVRLVIRIEDRPTYMESGILERLIAKLERERRRDPAPPPPKKDDGESGDDA